MQSNGDLSTNAQEYSELLQHLEQLKKENIDFKNTNKILGHQNLELNGLNQAL